MSLAFIAQAGVCSGTTQINLSGSAVSTPSQHRSVDSAITDSDIVSGDKYICTVKDASGNVASIVGTITTGSPSTITGIVELSDNGTSPIADTASVDVFVVRRAADEFISIALGDETSDAETGTGVVTFRMPYAFELTEVRASAVTAPVGSTAIIDINEGGVSILSTAITLDAGEKTSETAATPPVISDSALADDAEITIDIDQVGSTTAGAGFKVTLIGRRVS